MSFSIDLWNGFDIIKSSFYLNSKRIKQALDILTSYSLVQKDYYKGLDNLYKEIKETKEINKSNSLLDDTINSLIYSIKAESDIYKNHYNNTTRSISEIKEKLDIIKATVSPYFNDNLQNKDLFYKELNTLILKQETFNRSCKQLCYCLAEIEAQKLQEQKSNNKEVNDKEQDTVDNKNSKDEKDKEKDYHYKDIITKNFIYYISNNILKDLPNKKEALMKKALENKKEFLNCISETEIKRQNYNKKTEELLTHLNKQYKALIFLFQTLVHNYIKDKMNVYKEIMQINKANDIDKYSKINYKSITLDFITKNATKEFPMDKIEFIPYKINENKINQKLIKLKYNNFSPEQMDKIINQVKKNINSSKINIHENEIFKQLTKNNESTTKFRNRRNLIKIRRSGSSGKIEIKNINIGNDNFLNNFEKNIYNKNEELNNNRDLSEKDNIKEIKNKDDIMLDKYNEKKNNFIFIQNFVSKLLINNIQNKNDENKKYTIYDIYSDNLFYEDEDKDEKEEKSEKNNVKEESYMYNQLLFYFMDLISPTNKEHNEYLDHFIKTLSYNRSKGYFLLNENCYKIFVNIFNFILVNYKTNNNFIKNIIILSQTFYKMDNNKNNKIYILNGLKNNVTFNNPETWHRAINYSLSLALKINNTTYSFNIQNREEYFKNLNKVVLNVIISYLYDLKLSTNDIEVYEQVKNFYIEVYKLDKKLVESQVENLYGNIEKENNKKIEKNDNNEKNEDEKNKEKNNEDEKNEDKKNENEINEKKEDEKNEKDENIQKSEQEIENHKVINEKNDDNKNENKNDKITENIDIKVNNIENINEKNDKNNEIIDEKNNEIKNNKIESINSNEIFEKKNEIFKNIEKNNIEIEKNNIEIEKNNMEIERISKIDNNINIEETNTKNEKVENNNDQDEIIYKIENKRKNETIYKKDMSKMYEDFNRIENSRTESHLYCSFGRININEMIKKFETKPNNKNENNYKGKKKK